MSANFLTQWLESIRYLRRLSTVIDPDLKKDIVSMGMIKDLELADGNLKFTLELTTPACPFNVEIEDDVRRVVGELSELKNFESERDCKGDGGTLP